MFVIADTVQAKTAVGRTIAPQTGVVSALPTHPETMALMPPADQKAEKGQRTLKPLRQTFVPGTGIELSRFDPEIRLSPVWMQSFDIFAHDVPPGQPALSADTICRILGDAHLRSRLQNDAPAQARKFGINRLAVKVAEVAQTVSASGEGKNQ